MTRALAGGRPLILEILVLWLTESFAHHIAAAINARMIKRLPRYAELKLQSLCAEGDALCHKVDEDESGWDFLVELPAKAYSGPADMRPPGARAYVQVKSAKRERLTCRVTLSNALRAAQSSQPWFMVLVVEAADGPRLYAVHFWERLIRRTLEAARRAHNENRSLNKSTITVQFSAEDEKGAELVEWMQATIDGVKPRYEDAKRAINESAGFEDGYGEGVMTIEAGSEDEILRNFLGLGDGLPLNRFTFTPSRFGIASPSPMIDAPGGRVHIMPEPVGEIEVRIRGGASSEIIVLAGKVYGANLPGLSSAQRRVRFSAAFMEILWGPEAGSEFHARLPPEEKFDLATIEKFAALNEWLATGPIDVQVWFQGKRAVGGVMSQNEAASGLDWRTMRAAVRYLRAVAGPENQERIKVSLRDLSVASGLKTFTEIFDAPSFRTIFTPAEDAPAQLTVLVYWVSIDVGAYTFYALFEGKVAEDVLVDGQRRVTTRRRRMVEGYVLTNSTDAERGMMAADYARHVARLDDSEEVLGFGNLRDHLGASTDPASRENGDAAA